MSAGSIKIGARAGAPRAPRRVGPNPAAPRNPAQTLSSRDSPIRRFRQPSDPSPRQLRTRGLPRGDIGPGTPDRDVRDRGNVGAGTKPVGAAAPSRSRARSGIVGGLEWEHRRGAGIERNVIMDRARCVDRPPVPQASPAGPGSGASACDGSLEAHRLRSNRPIEDGPKLLGDVVVPRVGRPMHRGNLLKFERSGWRMKEAAERLAKRVAGT